MKKFAIILATTAALILCIEGILRIFDIHYYIPGLETHNQLNSHSKARLSKYFIESHDKNFLETKPEITEKDDRPYALGVKQRFSKMKNPNSIRVVFIGDSNIYNFNDHHPVFTECLEKKTSRKVEYINMAFQSCASTRSLLSLREALTLQPDFIVIYTGTSEFISACNMKTFPDPDGMQRWLITLYLNSSFFQLSARLASMLGETFNARLLDSLVVQKYSKEKHESFFADFKKNLSEMAKLAHNNKATLVFSTLAYNYMVPPISATAAENKRFEIMQSRSMQEQKQYFDSIRYKISNNSSSPFEEYELGQYLYRQKDFKKAKRHIDNAFTRLNRPARASKRMNQIVLEVASATNTPFVDIKTIADNAAPHGMADESICMDHCHLNERGNKIMAKAFCSKIASLSKGSR